VELSGLRAEYPALGRLAYLNAGTDGPLAAGAVRAAAAELARELEEGRAQSHFERRRELTDALRSTYATALGCEAEDIALTTCTSEGLAHAIGGLALGSGDEILTSDEEHPGLLGTLGAARELRGVSIREVPIAALAEAIGPRTRLIACSHVGWMSGLLAPAETSRSCWTEPRGWARSRSTCAGSAATHMPGPGRSGFAGPTARACFT
jgi:selenocysteine lyase/cysteine desulfurase